MPSETTGPLKLIGLSQSLEKRVPNACACDRQPNPNVVCKNDGPPTRGSHHTKPESTLRDWPGLGFCLRNFACSFGCHWTACVLLHMAW